MTSLSHHPRCREKSPFAAAASTAVLAALLAAFTALLAACSGLPGQKGGTAEASPPAPAVAAAGARSSSYGIKPFPEPEAWEKAVARMAENFPASKPSVVWIVGVMGDDEDTCVLQFPGSSDDPRVVFEDEDRHGRFLDYFDEAGIDVYLQVEPGMADMGKLIDLVLKRYGGHPCVAGFGVDVEWYKEAATEDFQAGWGTPVGDERARAWEERVKSYSADYALFLKHWDGEWMPPSYRGGIVFVNDSQGFGSADDMVAEFAAWGERFAPNPVWFQIGYDADRPWWQEYGDPAAELGKAVAEGVGRPCGLFWVDFTLRRVLPVESDEPLAVDDDPRNLALRRPAQASSVEGDGFGPECAFDGDPTTRWSSADSDPQWLTVDLEAPKALASMKIFWEDSYSLRYAVEASLDGEAWTTVHEENAGKGGEEEIDLKGVEARYLRLDCRERFTPEQYYGHSLYEVKVY